MKNLMLIALLSTVSAQAMDYTGKWVGDLLILRKGAAGQYVCICPCGNLRIMFESNLNIIKKNPKALKDCNVCHIVNKYKPKRKSPIRFLDEIKEED